MSSNVLRSEKRGNCPLVTVNILSYNRCKELEITLTKITQELDYPADQLEIIVVDNCSVDGTRDMIREKFPQVRLISTTKNIGIAGWNKGFEAGSGEYFLVLDDDCYIEGQSLKRAVQAAAQYGADLVSFHVANPNEPGFYFSENFRTGFLTFWGCSALISQRAISMLCGFDKYIFVYNHEAEFTCRLLDRGFKHLFLPSVTALHMKPVSFKYTSRTFRLSMRNLSLQAAKLLQPKDAVIAIINLMLRVLRQAKKSFRSVSILCAFPGIIEGVWTGLIHRRPVRPVVSCLYRQNYIEYVGSSALEDCQGFWSDRPDLYPKDTAVFYVPIERPSRVTQDEQRNNW